MGQGHYNAIGFGCLEPKALTKRLKVDWEGKGTLGDDLYSVVSDGGGHSGYESKTNYIALFLADSGRDHVTMGPTTTFEGFVEWAHSLVTPAVVAKWERIRKKAKQRLGIDLPAGQLLFIADYD